jgi:tetratricopeptide (TPR) repeat protein
MLMVSVVLAHGAPSHKTDGLIPPVRENGDEIAAAREALRQAVSKHGDDHPVTAMMLSNLALAMREGGYFNYAERYARQSVDILERHFGPGDVTLVPPLNVLTEVAVSQGHYSDARAFANRALAIGPDAEAHYGTALHNLGAIDQAEGRFAEAADAYLRAVAAWRKFLPPGHPFFRITQTALQQVERAAKLTAHR